MDRNDLAYWQGTEPKTTTELREQIQDALLASEQWLDDASIKNEDDRTMVYAQIFWLRQLLKLADIELKKVL